METQDLPSPTGALSDSLIDRHAGSPLHPPAPQAVAPLRGLQTGNGVVVRGLPVATTPATVAVAGMTEEAVGVAPPTEVAVARAVLSHAIQSQRWSLQRHCGSRQTPPRNVQRVQQGNTLCWIRKCIIA